MILNPCANTQKFSLLVVVVSSILVNFYWKQLQEATSKLNSKNVILIGDFNARTGTTKETLNKTNHDENTIPDFYSKIYTLRNNHDKVVNNYGKRLIDHCISTCSYIANGRTLGDLDGKYTCHQPSGSSTVDYAIISEELRKFVKHFKVLDPDTGSDHSLICLLYTSPSPRDRTRSRMPSSA